MMMTSQPRTHLEPKLITINRDDGSRTSSPSSRSTSHAFGAELPRRAHDPSMLVTFPHVVLLRCYNCRGPLGAETWPRRGGMIVIRRPSGGAARCPSGPLADATTLNLLTMWCLAGERGIFFREGRYGCGVAAKRRLWCLFSGCERVISWPPVRFSSNGCRQCSTAVACKWLLFTDGEVK